MSALKTYIFYSSDSDALDSAISDIGVDNDYSEGSKNDKAYCAHFKVFVKNNHRLCVISCFENYYPDIIEPLVDAGKMELLGCEDECGHANREKPSLCLSEDDIDKVKLAFPAYDGSNFPGDLK